MDKNIKCNCGHKKFETDIGLTAYLFLTSQIEVTEDVIMCEKCKKPFLIVRRTSIVTFTFYPTSDEEKYTPKLTTDRFSVKNTNPEKFRSLIFRSPKYN